MAEATLAAATRRRRLLAEIYRYRHLYLLILPGIACFIIFEYIPMYGIVLAFKKYMVRLGITRSPWVGFDNFAYILKDGMFWRAFRNTIIISVMKLLIGFPTPIILSLLLNELRSQKYKRTIQSILYLPYFLSWVIIAGIVFGLFSSSIGVVNRIIVNDFGGEAIQVLGNPKYFRTLVYATSIWRGAGWGTIVYLAALAGINPELYESAYMDGAGRFRRMWSITLPSLRYAITILLILDMGGLMEAGFQQIFNLYSPTTYSVGDIIDTYVYRLGLRSFHYEWSTAIGLFKSVINCALLLSTNGIVKALGEEGIF